MSQVSPVYNDQDDSGPLPGVQGQADGQAHESENNGVGQGHLSDVKELASEVDRLSIEESDDLWNDEDGAIYLSFENCAHTHALSALKKNSSGTNATGLLGRMGVLPPAHEHFTLGTKSFPNGSRLFNNGFLPVGGIYVPFSTYSGSPPLISRRPIRCSKCGAAASSLCKINAALGKWTCAFCGETNVNSEDQAVLAALSHQDFQVSTVDYTIGNAYELSSNVLDLYQSDSIQSSIIFVIDQCMPQDQLQFLQASLLALVRRLPPGVRAGLITYSNSISLFDLTKSELATTLTLPAHQNLAKEYVEDLVYGPGVYLGALSTFSGALETCIRGLRSHHDDASTNGRNSYLAPAIKAAISVITNSDEVFSNEESARLKASVCLTTPPSLSTRSPRLRNGEMAVIREEMQNIGALAGSMRVCVDVHIAGHRPVNLPVLEPLTKETGGCLVMDEVFGEPFCANVEHFIHRRLAFRPELSLRLTHPLQLVRLIGPEVSEIEFQKQNRRVPAYSLQLSASYKNQGYAVFLESSANIPQQVYLEFSLTFVRDDMERVCRVTTVAVETCNGVNELASNVDCGVTAVLIAKRTLLDFNTTKDVKACLRRLRERNNGIASLFGEQRGYFSLMRRRLRFPQELRSLRQHLFFFENGPILGSLGLSLDERLVLKHHLLHADLITSLRMVHQRSFIINESQNKIHEEVPTSAVLRSERVIVVDHGSDIFVWIGSLASSGPESTSDARVDKMKRVTEKMAMERFPKPRVFLTFEGTSQARYVLCRLCDLHILQKDLDH